MEDGDQSEIHLQFPHTLRPEKLRKNSAREGDRNGMRCAILRHVTIGLREMLQPKIGNAMVICRTWEVAKHGQPSVIYVDDVEQIFAAVKKGKGGDPNAPSRIKKDMLAWEKMISSDNKEFEDAQVLMIEVPVRSRSALKSTEKRSAVFQVLFCLDGAPDYGSRLVGVDSCREFVALGCSFLGRH